MKRNGWLMLVIMLLSGLAVYQHTEKQSAASVPAAAQAAAKRVNPGEPVPALRLAGMDGRSYHIGGPREKPLLLNFWASWCGPCHQEAADLRDVYEANKDRMDLYAVNVTQGDSLPEAERFVKRYGLTFPILLDVTGRAADDYRIMFVPTSFLINKKGELVEVLHVLPREQLEAKVRQFVEAAG